MDMLSDVLEQMRLQGTLYFRTSFTSPWSIRVPPYKAVARFHYAHRGRCFVRIDPDQPYVQLEQGDLVIINRGASHVLFCDPATEGLAENLETVLEESGFTGEGALVWGEPESEHETQLICGHFAFDEKASHPLIDQLPDHIHIRNYGEVAGPWMEHTLRVIGTEAGRDQMGSELIALKLSEIIYTQAVRSYLQSTPNLQTGLEGFTDPRLARALKAMHKEPGKNWTVEDLATTAGLSRTAFATKFTQLMNMTPLSYLTQWRMQLARNKLERSREPIITIAEAVGYQSEAAFGRIFKKHFATGPASYRRQQMLEASAQGIRPA